MQVIWYVRPCIEVVIMPTQLLLFPLEPRIVWKNHGVQSAIAISWSLSYSFPAWAVHLPMGMPSPTLTAVLSIVSSSWFTPTGCWCEIFHAGSCHCTAAWEVSDQLQSGGKVKAIVQSWSPTNGSLVDQPYFSFCRSLVGSGLTTCKH